MVVPVVVGGMADDDPAAAFEAGLRVGESTFDGDDAALLRAVDREGSLSRAADELGRSYSRAHRRVSELEAATGPLVERTRGGPDGGGSELTATARRLLGRFDRLAAALAETATVDETVLRGTVTARDGELVTVETPAGDLRAVVATAGDAGPGAAVGAEVAVAVRADAVTLYDPERAPRADDTSARNRFEGTVAGLDRAAAVATVRVDVGAPTRLVALLTAASVDRLALSAGDRVAASFKATAARATPASERSA